MPDISCGSLFQPLLQPCSSWLPRMPPLVWVVAGLFLTGQTECWSQDAPPKISTDFQQQAVQYLTKLGERLSSAGRPNQTGQAWDEIQETRLQQANRISSEDWHKVRTREEWDRFCQKRLDALRENLGIGSLPDLNSVQIRVTSRIAGDGFEIENVIFRSRHDRWVSANLYRPLPTRSSMPGIVISHAHHTSKEHGELQDMGMTWARAGCVVLIPDHVGHGERRQHPFGKASDFSRKFRVGPADYYFRYDTAIQLDLVGHSLMGWMVQDLSRAADVLLSQEGVDGNRLILLGAVAGGGDPAAVTGALDQRFAAVVPFNFGGPQPESQYPLPADAELTFDYAGGGSWESTRNLRGSASGGYLPWVIVGAIAPRKLIYGHEFSWDQDRDPVWKRLRKVYGFFNESEGLAFTHGIGVLQGQPPAASHCTHIGKPHRVRIHQAFENWFRIKVNSETEFSQRVPAEKLQCWTEELKKELQPLSIAALSSKLADVAIVAARSALSEDLDLRRRQHSQLWNAVLERGESKHTAENPRPTVASVLDRSEGNLIRSELLQSAGEGSHGVSCVLVTPVALSKSEPLLVMICSRSLPELLQRRRNEVGRVLEKGAPVCLFSVRDQHGLSGDRETGRFRCGRRSELTSRASTELMLGSPLLGVQLAELRRVISILRSRKDIGGRPLHLRAESFVTPNSLPEGFIEPRDDDSTLPAPSEPQAPLLALLAGLFEEDISLIEVTGCVASWKMLLVKPLVLMSYESLVPGVLNAGDISDLVENQKSGTRVILRRSVDGLNRKVSPETLRQIFGKALAAKRLEISED